MYAFDIMNPTVTYNYNAPREMHKRKKREKKEEMLSGSCKKPNFL